MDRNAGMEKKLLNAVEIGPSCAANRPKSSVQRELGVSRAIILWAWAWSSGGPIFELVDCKWADFYYV